MISCRPPSIASRSTPKRSWKINAHRLADERRQRVREHHAETDAHDGTRDAEHERFGHEEPEQLTTLGADEPQPCQDARAMLGAGRGRVVDDEDPGNEAECADPGQDRLKRSDDTLVELVALLRTRHRETRPDGGLQRTLRHRDVDAVAEHDVDLIDATVFDERPLRGR